jgi:nucleotide-binding universal stress UspA family protein
MYNKIIAALGLSHGHGVTALEMARRMRAENGTIIALHVLEPVPGFASNFLPPDHESQLRATAESAIRERVGEQADAKVVVLSGYPGRTITEYAKEVGADCIIVGSHKPELQDYLLGSTAARVVRHAPCSVHVLR